MLKISISIDPSDDAGTTAAQLRQLADLIKRQADKKPKTLTAPAPKDASSVDDYADLPFG